MGQIVPKGTEASVFALVTSLQMVGGTAGGAISAVLTEALGVTLRDYSRLADLVIITSCVKLVSIPFIALVPAHISVARVRKPTLLLLLLLRHPAHQELSAKELVPKELFPCSNPCPLCAWVRIRTGGNGAHEVWGVPTGYDHGRWHCFCCLHCHVQTVRGQFQLGCAVVRTAEFVTLL